MPTCGITQTIFGTECIGDSLAKINSNFNRLELAVCELSAAPPPELKINIRSGDGLSIYVDNDENVSEDNFIINANNSVQYIPASQMSVTPYTTDQLYKPTPFNVKCADQTVVRALQFKWFNPAAVKPATTNFAFFETVALGDYPPAVTLYWRSAANAPFKIYATNDNLVSNLLFTPFPNTNGHIFDVELDGDGSSKCFVGGYFYKIGNYANSLKCNFATIDLVGNAGANAAEVGPAGQLSSIPGTTDDSVILNSTSRFIGPKKYTAGFNSRVRVIKRFIHNSQRYLAVGGQFNGSNTLGFLGRGLILFNLTTHEKYEFQVNGNVYDCMPYANYLYVCGGFNTGNAVNAVEGDIELPALFRINLDNLNGNKSQWIDRDFNENVKKSFRHVDGKTYGANATYYIYTMEYHNDYLYIGGRQYAYRGNVRPAFNYCLSVLNLETGAIVTDWTCLFYYRADAGPIIFKLKVETIFDDVERTKPLRTVLYAGGRFSNVNMIENRFSAVRGKPNTWKARQNIASFTLQIFDFNGLPQADYSNRPLLTEWTAAVNGDVRDILPETPYSSDPLYISGSFKSVNGRPIPYLAAIRKPQGITQIAAVYNEWNMGLNGPVYTMTYIPSGSPINQGMTSKKASLIIGGGFTRVAGVAKNYLARVSCVNQNIGTSPLSSVVWKIVGQALNPSDKLELVPDNVLVACVTANPSDSLNVTRFPPLSGGFESVTKGDLCRFLITRGATDTIYTETYTTNDDNIETAKGIYLLGVSIDYNTAQIEGNQYTEVTNLTSTFEALTSVPGGTTGD